MVLCRCDLPLKILDLKTATTLEGKEKEEGSSSKKTKKVWKNQGMIASYKDLHIHKNLQI